MVFIIEDIIQDDINFLVKVLQEDGSKIKTKMDGLLYNFEQYIKTGDTSFLQNELNRHSHIKENLESTMTMKKDPQKKGVLTDIKEDNIPIIANSVKIKCEKISEVFTPSQVSSPATVPDGSDKCSVNSTINSNNEEMPAPKQLPPRKRKIKEEPIDLPKRSTRTRKKPERFTASSKVSSGKVSDVMIQNTTIPIVVLTDGPDQVADGSIKEKSNENNKQEVEPIRSKRTRTIRKAKVDLNEVSNEPLPNKQTDQLNQENSVPSEIKTIDPNATFDIRSEPVAVNSTIIIEKTNIQDENITPITPTKQKKKKEIFSPFDKVSTKAKVEAFEKLNAVSSNSPALKTKQDKQTEEQQKCTPVASKLYMKGQSTTKVNKFIPRKDSSSSNSMISSKSQSALKASQAEFRERLKKKQEKEQEALKKREAILLALTEERKKKREEKQFKAQQQRELHEKEKLKLMEAQKLKEEKCKQALLEEKHKKQKEEAERKILPKKKLEDKEQINKPIYMTTEAPLLPTNDCYDSDDEESEGVQPREIPKWSGPQELRKMQIIMLKIGEKIKNTFFSRKVHTPDLQEIFEEIDPRKLKRTSSAVWRKPPRYTVFLESSDIQFSEDDE